MNTPLKPGDRVRVYHGMDEFCGHVNYIYKEGTISVKIDHGDGGREMIVHPKQCRRLKKKERRRVWLKPNPGTSKVIPFVEWTTNPAEAGDDWIEFIEVKRRKE